MAKERLSKLQKWILIEAYKRNISKFNIYENYWKDGIYYGKAYGYLIDGKAKVSLCRSLKRLNEKNLIFRINSKLGNIRLTDEGKKQANILVHGINNKKKQGGQ